jgi:hypothetical protein
MENKSIPSWGTKFLLLTFLSLVSLNVSYANDNLFIGGTITWRGTSASIEGVTIILLKSSPPRDGSGMPEFKEAARTVSDKDGNYNFVAEKGTGYMVQLSRQNCSWNSSRIPVTKKHEVGKDKFLINLSTTADSCKKNS